MDTGAVSSGSRISLAGYQATGSSRSEEPKKEEKNPVNAYFGIGARILVPSVTGMPDEIRTIPYPASMVPSYKLHEGTMDHYLDFNYYAEAGVVLNEALSLYVRGGDIGRDPMYYSYGADYTFNERLSVGYQFEQYSQGFRDGFTYRERDDFVGESYPILHVTPRVHEAHISYPISPDLRVGVGAQYHEVDFVQAYDWYDNEENFGTVDTGKGYGVRIFGEWGEEHNGPGIFASYTYANVEPEKFGGSVNLHMFQMGLSYDMPLLR